MSRIFYGPDGAHPDSIDDEIRQLVERIEHLSVETKSADAALMRMDKIRELVKALLPRLKQRHEV